MRKRIVFLVLCFCIACAFILTACNIGGSNTGGSNSGGGSGDTSGAKYMEVIVKGNTESPNYFSCTYDKIPNNHEAFTLDDVQVKLVYKSGNKKTLKKDEYTVSKYDTNGNISFSKELFDFMKTGETGNNVPGTYKLFFSTTDKAHSTDLTVVIYKGEALEHDFSIKKYSSLDYTESVVENSSDSFVKVEYGQHYSKYNDHYFFEANSVACESKDITYVVISYLDKIEIGTNTVIVDGKTVEKDGFIDRNKVGTVDGVRFLNNEGKILSPGNYYVFAKFGELSPYYSLYSTHPKKVAIGNQKIIDLTVTQAFEEYEFEGNTDIMALSLNLDPTTPIAKGAFTYCTSLSSVTIGNSVTSIGRSAFYGCTSLSSVTIGNSVTSIGNWAFFNCDSLTSVTIPDSVTSIGDDAFIDCDSLISVTIGNSVTSVGSSAFRDCDSLTSVTIGNSVTSIESQAFDDCDSLSTVYYNGTKEEWSGISIGGSNYDLKGATRYYYSETVPTTSGNYWHYGDDGVPTPW